MNRFRIGFAHKATIRRGIPYKKGNEKSVGGSGKPLGNGNKIGNCWKMQWD